MEQAEFAMTASTSEFSDGVHILYLLVYVVPDCSLPIQVHVFEPLVLNLKLSTLKPSTPKPQTPKPVNP